MAKRKTTEELIAELKLFNHHEAAKRMEELEATLQRARESTGFGELAFPQAPKPQHQGALEDQLDELDAAAARDGLYDAQDWLRQRRQP